MSFDTIGPPTASRPGEALQLVCEALSEGDLEAAVSLYEPAALLCSAGGRRACGTDQVRQALAELMAPRLPVRADVRSELVSGDLALVLAVRTVSGTAIDGSRFELAGEGALLLRQSPARGWQVVADDWRFPAWPT